MRWLLLCGLLAAGAGCAKKPAADRGPGVPPDDCEGMAIACEDDGGSRKKCQKILDDCVAWRGPWNDPCDSIPCESKGLDEETCQVFIDDCRQQHPPPRNPCVARVLRCYDKGIDEETCLSLARECKPMPKDAGSDEDAQ